MPDNIIRDRINAARHTSKREREGRGRDVTGSDLTRQAYCRVGKRKYIFAEITFFENPLDLFVRNVTGVFATVLHLASF